VFVSLGLGSVIASAIDVAPWLTVAGRQKGLVFTLVGVMLAFNYWFVIVRARRGDCEPGELCHPDSPGTRANRILFWVSVLVYVVAVLGAYAASSWVRRQG
jgi:hypothetical protein